MPQTTIEFRKEASEDELRARAAEMRNEWAEVAAKRGTEDYAKGKTEFLAEVEDIDLNLSLRQLATAPPSPRRAPAGALDEAPNEHEFRSVGEQVVENEEFKNWMKANAGSSGHLRSTSPDVELRDLVTLGTSSNLTLPVQQPALIGVRRRRLFLRDLFSVVSVSQSAVPYIRELNAVANEAAAATFQEGGVTPKAQAKIEFAPDLAVTTTIAVNIPITTQMLEDSGFIRGYVDTRLGYLIEVEEEDQLLNGTGIAPNLKGLLEYVGEGLQTQAAVAGETAQTIMKSIVKVQVLDAEPDYVVMNPVDAGDMFVNRAAGGAGTFDAGTPFSAIPLNVWGLPVVRTNAVAAGTSIVGNFQLGATVLDRRSATVRVYEQHENYATLNRVLIQAEERVGLMVTNPDFFVLTSLA